MQYQNNKERFKIEQNTNDEKTMMKIESQQKGEKNDYGKAEEKILQEEKVLQQKKKYFDNNNNNQIIKINNLIQSNQLSSKVQGKKTQKNVVLSNIQQTKIQFKTQKNQNQDKHEENILDQGKIEVFDQKNYNQQNQKQQKVEQKQQKIQQIQQNIINNKKIQRIQILNEPKIEIKKSQQDIKTKQINQQSLKPIKSQFQPKNPQYQPENHQPPVFPPQQLPSSQQPIQYSDPILNVRDQIARNFRMNFQDTIFIKKGTKINSRQFYRAKDLMNVWKYFNVKTKNIQILDISDKSIQNVDNIKNVQKKIQVKKGQQNSHKRIINKMKLLLRQQRQQYQRKYHISKYEQIPFCIIIPSYKNSDKYFRNINSILQQDYTNFHVIYIDDASNDGTAQLISQYISKYQISQQKLKFIQNKYNKRALPNIDNVARNMCKSGEIMAIIDGDDYLIGRQVFKVINAQYQRKKLLALYTNHIRVHEPIYKKVGTCIDYPKSVKLTRAYRHFSIFPASHLRTFYVDLYWRIQPRDLKDTRGQYFHAANDFAIMMPILEMAGDRFQYLPELTYVYDAGTGYNNFQTKNQMQAKNFNTTKRRNKYSKLPGDLQFAEIYYKKNNVKLQKGKKNNKQNKNMQRRR